MRRILPVILAFLLSSLPLAGRGGKVFAAMEWGAGITLADIHLYNYLLEGGYRMNGSEIYFGGKINAYWQGSIGYEISPTWSLALNAGYEGVDRQYRVYPVTLRATHDLQSSTTDGWFLYGEGGAGFWSISDISVVLGRLGAGYRIALTRHTLLDFLLSYRLSIRNPDLFDPDSTRQIPPERIALNHLYANKLTLSVALSFR